MPVECPTGPKMQFLTKQSFQPSRKKRSMNFASVVSTSQSTSWYSRKAENMTANCGDPACLKLAKRWGNLESREFCLDGLHLQCGPLPLHLCAWWCPRNFTGAGGPRARGPGAPGPGGLGARGLGGPGACGPRAGAREPGPEAWARGPGARGSGARGPGCPSVRNAKNGPLVPELLPNIYGPRGG